MSNASKVGQTCVPKTSADADLHLKWNQWETYMERKKYDLSIIFSIKWNFNFGIGFPFVMVL